MTTKQTHGLQQVQRIWLVRSTLLLTVLAFLALGLVGRAVWLQVVEHDFLAFEGDKRYNRAMLLPASRGAIKDRAGRLLAHSTPVETVWVDPKLFVRDERTAAEMKALAQALGVPVSDLDDKFARYANKRFMYLQRRMTPEQAADVVALDLPGIQSQEEYLRVYPHGELVGHVLGFTNTDDEGISGMELAYQNHLLGKPGKLAFVRDGTGRVVGYRDGDVAPIPGSALQLSLDLHLQHIAYRELVAAVAEFGAKGGTVVITDPYTGEILALVNQPGYNPNDTQQRVGAAVRNRAITDEFEPGSTVKPFLMAAALEAGEYSPDSIVDTAPGQMALGGHTIQDFSNYGEITLTNIIAKSSNVGSAKVALSLDGSALYSMYSRLGFGRPTYLDFPGETSGRLKGFDTWYPSEHASLGYGYGLSVSAIQLAQAYAILAADGEKHPVTLLKQSSMAMPERVVSREIANQVTAMLEQVVTRQGTGRRAVVNGYRVAGKTGTVHKVGPQGYDEDRYRALFAGFAPASKPRFVTVVIIDEPNPDKHFGGQVAAPVFAKIMSQALREYDVRPDGLPGNLNATGSLSGSGLVGDDVLGDGRQAGDS